MATRLVRERARRIARGDQPEQRERPASGSMHWVNRSTTQGLAIFAEPSRGLMLLVACATPGGLDSPEQILDRYA